MRRLEVFALTMTVAAVCAVSGRPAAAQYSDTSPHPLNWSKVIVHLPHFDDRIDAVGMRDAFQRVAPATWEAHLPRGAWLHVKLTPNTRFRHSQEHVIEWKGEATIRLESDGERLYKVTRPNQRGTLIGITVLNPFQSDVERALTITRRVESLCLVRASPDPEPLRPLARLQPRSLVVLQSTAKDQLKLDGFHTLACLVVNGDASLEQTLPLTRLLALKLMKWPGEELPALTAATNLCFLELNCGKSVDLSPLSRLTKLQALVLSGSAEPSVPLDVSPLKELASLTIAHNRLADIDALATLPHLTRLHLSGPLTLDAQKLLVLEKLTSLDPGGFHDEAMKQWAAAAHEAHKHLSELTWSSDPTLLNGMTSIRTLLIRGAGPRSIPTMERLESLNIKEFSGVTFSDPLPNLRNLKIESSFHNFNDADFSQLPDAPNLHHLTVANPESLVSLAGLERYTSLTLLDISRCEELEDITPLEKLTALTHLRLKEARLIASLKPLTRASRLQSLQISHSRHLTTLDGLQNKVKIEELSVRGSGRLNDIAAATTMRELRHLDLHGCPIEIDSLRVITNLRKLEALGMTFPAQRQVEKQLRTLATERNFEIYFN